MTAQLVPIAQRDDAAAQHGQRRRARPRGIHGEQYAALEDPVDAHRVPIIVEIRGRRCRSLACSFDSTIESKFSDAGRDWCRPEENEHE